MGKHSKPYRVEWVVGRKQFSMDFYFPKNAETIAARCKQNGYQFTAYVPENKPIPA